MIVAIEGNDAHRLLLSVDRHDGTLTRIAAWREFLMETINAVTLHVDIDRKRYSIETLLADAAGEALRMVGFARRSKDLEEATTGKYIRLPQRGERKSPRTQWGETVRCEQKPRRLTVISVRTNR